MSFHCDFRAPHSPQHPLLTSLILKDPPLHRLHCHQCRWVGLAPLPPGFQGLTVSTSFRPLLIFLQYAFHDFTDITAGCSEWETWRKFPRRPWSPPLPCSSSDTSLSRAAPSLLPVRLSAIFGWTGRLGKDGLSWWGLTLQLVLVLPNIQRGRCLHFTSNAQGCGDES